MKTLIFAGGYGTRLTELTKVIPKPMVRIGDIPIIEHIINIYSSYNFNDFIIAMGYKQQVIKDYFIGLFQNNGDIALDFAKRELIKSDRIDKEWHIELIDTGLDTMTGGRIRKSIDFLSDTFFLTYGDGLSNVNLDLLLKCHKNSGKLLRASKYTFHAVLAENFKFNNCFLIGDAAHQTPPFLGQGLCQGIKDAYNLCWKLSGVIEKKYDKKILESFSTERKESALRMEKDLSIAGIRNRKFGILGHPFGMTIRRFGYIPQITHFEELISECKVNEVVFELNLRYHQPMLNDLLPLLINSGVKWTLGSNSHSANELKIVWERYNKIQKQEFK